MRRWTGYHRHETGHLARLGDRSWGETLARYYELIRETVKRFGGREIDADRDAVDA